MAEKKKEGCKEAEIKNIREVYHQGTLIDGENITTQSLVFPLKYLTIPPIENDLVRIIRIFHLEDYIR